MSTSDPAADGRPGLSNVIDIIVSPGSAFTRLREVPTWGWALLVSTLLGIAGTLVVSPVIAHAMDLTLPAQLAASPDIAKLPPDQQHATIAMRMKISHVIAQIYWIFVPVGILFGALVQTVIMLIANAVSHGDGTFKKFFALSVTVSIVGIGISSVVLAIIVAIRGADSFETPTAVQGALPSLALLAPGARGALAGFLGALNVFYIWAIVLLALGMTRVARISPAVAWSTAIAMLLITACFSAFGSAQNG